MREHLIESEIFLPHPREKVFAFFSEAKNLGEITPDSLGFEILPPAPPAIEEGAIIDYRIRLRGWPMRWRTLIRDWQPPFEFTDEQLRGPYRLWIHRHTFEEIDGGTLVRDRVRYALPFAPLGEIALPLVKAELNQIFAYRTEAMKRLFPATC
jgi:ligand-binding SRPBCC domain-containing protein